tara:strand:+ start:258 stop:1148 length:891 start_codon:yes stop_codon:yes gene_type:complete
MEKVLIGVGCSHTSGCACVIGAGTEHQEYELASFELKQKYKKEKVSTDWITENFSWIGKLGNLLNVDKKINFGSGGKGVEHCVRTLRNYAHTKKDLSNHLIIFQVPSFDRREVVWKNGTVWCIELLRNMLNMINNSDGIVKTFYQYFHNEDFYVVKYMYELVHIQKYMESLGAKIIFFIKFSSHMKTIKETPERFDDMIDKFQTYHNKHNWSSDITKMISMKDLYNSLNIINFPDTNWLKHPLYTGKKGFGKYFDHTLQSEGLLRNDSHLSEDGNKKLAAIIYDLIKDEPLFIIGR